MDNVFKEGYCLTIQKDGACRFLFKDGYEWRAANGIQFLQDATPAVLAAQLTAASKYFSDVRLEKLKVVREPLDMEDGWGDEFRRTALAKLNLQEIEALGLTPVAIYEKMREEPK